MNPNEGVKIEGLSFSYGARQALKNISLSVRPGVFTALLGPNGAGKSTLVALLSSLFAPKPGCVRVFGLDIATDPLPILARSGILFQQPSLDLDLSVGQNMAYFAALHGFSGKEAEKRIDLALEVMDMAARLKEKARNLNGGHRRRLEIARILVHQPKFLLLDEPTVGLDVASRSTLVERLHQISRDEGLTLLWATHLVDEIEEGDDLIVLHEGSVRAEGSLEEVLKQSGAKTPLEAFRILTATGQEEAA